MKRHLPALLILVIATLAVYVPVRTFDFINYDDEDYIVKNEMVAGGLSGESFAWALTADKSATWQPLTWISLMMDAGGGKELDAGRFHTTNLAFHLINALLLYALLFVATRAVWPAALAALLFAIHPLHVESVAWVTERKDVLSVFWGLISLLAWVRYARTGSKPLYGLAIVALALGLMAKPLLVTWPFVMLLLDWWPLRRLGAADGSENGAPALPRKPLSALLIEKIPFFVLTVISSVISYRVHQGADAFADLGAVGLGDRLANAAVQYARYLGMTFWPRDHSILYPHPNLAGGTPLTGAAVGGAIALLIAVTAAVFALRRRRYLAMGWLLYVGTLVPLSGVVQFGTHAGADRFTYVPLIGVFVALAWLARDLHEWLSRRGPDWLVPVVAFALALALVLPAHTLCAKWSDSITLYEYSLESQPGSPKIHYNLGTAYSVAQRFDKAVPQYEQAIELQPHHDRAWNNLGRTLGMLRRYDEAAEAFEESIRLRPERTLARINYAKMLEKAGRLDAAIAQRVAALEQAPDPANANQIGVLWAQRGNFAEAIPYFQRALQMRPGWQAAAQNLARAQGAAKQGRERSR